MVDESLLCVVLIFLAVLCCVETQICTESKREYVKRSELRNTSSVIIQNFYCYHYLDTSVHICSRKRKIWTTKLVTVLEYKPVQKCCPGYIQDNTSSSESLECKPVCTEHCENGFCAQPNICSCHEGYRKKTNSSFEFCEPVCEHNCTNGKCVSVNTCECNHGYVSLNDTCEPVCSYPCINGECTAPETCKCLPGYKMFNSTGCEHERDEKTSGDGNWLLILLGIIMLLIVISVFMLIFYEYKILRYFKDFTKLDAPETPLNVTFSNIKKEDK